MLSNPQTLSALQRHGSSCTHFIATDPPLKKTLPKRDEL